MKSKTPIVILSGGKSSRMQRGDKALLEFGGFNSLAEFQYKRLNASFQRVYISTKLDKFSFDANFIFDREDTFSPLIAIESIFEKLDSDRIFLLSVDTPFVQVQTIKEILSFNSEVVVAKSPNGVEPLCGVYSRALLPRVKEMLSKDIHKLNYLIKSSKSQYITFNIEEEFLNLNRDEDYLKALNLISIFDTPAHK